MNEVFKINSGVIHR